MRKVYLLAIACLFSGCSQYGLHNIDKPPPEDYELWEKESQSELQIKKALLECGAIAPSTLGWPYRDAYKKLGIITYDEQMNNYYQTNKCMENAGYKKKWRMRSAQAGCNDLLFPERKKYPACQPDAVILTPRIERRLNSWYCKVKSDYQYCLAYALAPQLCSREKADNPPPECLPPGEEYKTPLATQPNQYNYTEPYTPIRDFPERSLQLQQEMQRNSNRQMDKLLRDTFPNTSR